jgi:hypothetical protein
MLAAEIIELTVIVADVLAKAESPIELTTLLKDTIDTPQTPSRMCAGMFWTSNVNLQSLLRPLNGELERLPRLALNFMSSTPEHPSNAELPMERTLLVMSMLVTFSE